MMNMLDLQDKLKNLSEDQLVGQMQTPSGEVPQFLVLGEIDRRKRMRNDAQRQQGTTQSTVAQDVVTAAGVPQAGIAGMAQAMAPRLICLRTRASCPPHRHLKPHKVCLPLRR